MTMTSARSGPARSRTMVRVGLLSLGAAIVILGGLALQMALGRDPALGPKLGSSEADAPEDPLIAAILSSISAEAESPEPVETTTS